MRRTLGIMATAGALALGAAGTADAAIVTQPVRGFDATEGQRVSPDDRLVAFGDDTGCNPDAYTVTISWGDGTTSAGVIDFDSGGVGRGCDYGASGRHTYARAGTYTVTASVCSVGVGVCVPAAGGIARVANAPVRGEGRSLSAVAGRLLTAQIAEFDDDNRSARATDYTTVVDWGDGTTSPGVLSGDEGRFDVSGEHTYASAGQYLQRVTLLENGVPVAVSSPGTVNVAAAAPAPIAQSAPSRSITGARPALRMRVSSIRRRSLYKGLPIQASLPASTRSLRVAVVRIVGSRAQTLGTVPVQVRGGLLADGVRQVALRVRLSKALRKRMKAGRYALQFRVDDSGTVTTLFRVR